MGNPNHSAETGRFSSGSDGAAATGDHQAASPDTATRNVPGHGNVPRSQVVAKHNGQKSVGVSAKSETIAKGKRIDDTHYPPRSNAEATAMTDLSRMQGSQTATKGRFKYQGR